MTRKGVMFATMIAVLAACPNGMGQELELDARAGVGTGVESGESGHGSVELRRARTRALVAVGGRVDERPKNELEVVVFAEVEPHASLGAELRVSRSLGTATRGFAGAVAVAAPHTLLGGGFGLRVLMSGDPSRSTLFVEPSIAILPLGTDIAGEQVIVWGLLSAGFYGSL